MSDLEKRLTDRGYDLEQLEKDSPFAIDFESDEPLACPLDRNDGEPCESCQ